MEEEEDAGVASEWNLMKPSLGFSQLSPFGNLYSGSQTMMMKDS